MAIERGTGSTTAYYANRTQSSNRPAWTREPLSEKQQRWMDTLVSAYVADVATLASLQADAVMLAPGEHTAATRADGVAAIRTVAADFTARAEALRSTTRGDFDAAREQLTADQQTVNRQIDHARKLVGAHLSRIAGRPVTGATVAAASAAAAAEDGATYRAPDGRVFHAYLGQSGRLLLKLWEAHEDVDADNRATGEFAYYGAAVKLPAGSVRLTTDECAEFGRATGTCAICMRHLTDDESVARGIGPVCWGKL